MRVVDNEYLPEDCSKTLVDVLPYPSKEIFNNTQSDIIQDKLAIIFDWFFSLNHQLKLREDTYQFTIRLIDAYVTSRPIVITKLQLLALAALYTAMMIREKYMTESLELVRLSDGTYSSQDLVIMHKDILVAIDYGIYIMTPYDFHVVNRTEDDLISRQVDQQRLLD